MATPAQAPVHAADTPCFHCPVTQEFHDKVLSSLAALDVGQKAIVGRLDKINGSVGELFHRTNEHARQIAVLDSAGGKALDEARKAIVDVREEMGEASEKIAGRVSVVEKAVSESAAADKGAKGVLQTLKPLLWMAVSAIIVVLAMHANDLLKRL